MVSQWVATEIVMSHSIRQRTATIEKLIQIANKCVEMKNFNSFMEILGGLNRGSVRRMKKAWESVSPASLEIFESLNSIVDPRRNFNNYREQLKKKNVPCLPYFGIYLRDLTFADEVVDKVGEYINFEKILTNCKILKDVQFFQKTSYTFAEDEGLQNLLRRLLAMPEEMLYKHSQTLEPTVPISPNLHT